MRLLKPCSNWISRLNLPRRLNLRTLPSLSLTPAVTSVRTSSPTPPRFSQTERLRGFRLVSGSLVSSAPSSSSLTSTKTSRDGVVGTPINFDVAAAIDGNESQIVTVELQPGQVLRAESGAMMYMTEGVEMNTTTGGGVSAGFQRMLTGQNFFISDYTYTGEPGTKGVVALGTDFPSKILRLNVQEYGGKIVCQKGALLCASHTVDIEMEFTKNVTTGFFGGEGFVLQALKGEGDVFVKAGGTLIRRELVEGERLRISSGCLVAFVDADYGALSTRAGIPCVVPLITSYLDPVVSYCTRCGNGERLCKRVCRRGRALYDNIHRTRNRVASRPTGATNDQRDRSPGPIRRWNRLGCSDWRRRRRWWWWRRRQWRRSG